jgi:hypothetical protein
MPREGLIDESAKRLEIPISSRTRAQPGWFFDHTAAGAVRLREGAPRQYHLTEEEFPFWQIRPSGSAGGSLRNTWRPAPWTASSNIGPVYPRYIAAILATAVSRPVRWLARAARLRLPRGVLPAASQVYYARGFSR